MGARIGVLALQGDFTAHASALRDAGAETLEVRRIAELEAIDGLVIPGGESTTLLNLMRDEPWFPALLGFHARGRALMGTCAGAILLARKVTGPEQPSLGLLDAWVERNAYGRQVESFETHLDAPEVGTPVEAVFIRAPRFRALGPGVTVLASLHGEPVMVREGHVLALTFHPELTPGASVHRYFLDMVGTRRRRAATAAAGAESSRAR